MKGSKMKTILRLEFSKAIARWLELNNGAHVSRPIGWLVIGVAVVYSSIVTLLSSLNGAGFPLIFAVSMPVLLFVGLSFASKIHAREKTSPEEWVSAKRIFAAVSTSYLILAAFGWFTTPDTVWQWRQATGAEPFDDWHPIIHTFLLYIAAAMTRSVRGVVMIQACVFAALITWLYSTLRKYGYRRILSYLVIIIAVANPFSTTLLRVPWKDTAFAMTALALTICLINILETKGGWLSYKKLVGFVVLLFLASFIRHNGFFYTLPLATILLVSVGRDNRRKAFVALLLACAVSAAYVSLRTYFTNTDIVGQKRQIHGVSYQGFVESVGLPMCIMSESYVVHPEKTPPAVSNFLETLCDRECWEKNYDTICGEFNSVKFKCAAMGNPTGPKIAALGKKRFFSMFLDTIRMNPVSAIKAFLNVTSQAWSPFPKTINHAIVPTGTGPVAADINAYQTLVLLSPLGTLSSAPGFYILCIVLATCYGLLRSGYKVLVLTLPIILYQFGTMFFLTGTDYRFFYITVLTGGVVSLVTASGRDFS